MFSDKTKNLYLIDTFSYLMLLNDSVSHKIIEALPMHFNRINCEAKQIAINLGIADRVETLAKRNAF